MHRLFVVLSLPVVVAALALAGGCSSQSNGAADASMGPGIIVGSGDATVGDAASEASPVLGTTMRLANASSDLGPIDFCWRATGTASFTGPVLWGALPPPDGGPLDAPSPTDDTGSSPDAGAGAVADAGDVRDASEDGDHGDDASDAELPDAPGPPDASTPWALQFGAMTPDVPLPTAGTFDIALVTGGQSSCLQQLLVDAITVDVGKRATVVVIGQKGLDAGPSALTLAAFIDAPVDPQSVRARFIHAALGAAQNDAAPALSVRANTTLLAAEVDPGKATTPSTSPAVDSLGYTTLDAISGTVSLTLAPLGDATSTTWTTPATSLGLQSGSAHTGILVSMPQGALGVAWCTDVDNADGHTSCTLITALP